MPILKNYSIITEVSEVDAVIEALEAVDMFAYDLETTGLDFNRSIIHGVALATDKQEWYLCLGAEKEFLRKGATLFWDKVVIGHNLSFDNHFLVRYGITVRQPIDTMIGQWLVDENQSVALKSLAYTRLGITEDLPEFKDLLKLAKKLLGYKSMDLITIYDVPLDKLAEYAARDARMTYDLWLITEEQLHREGLLEMFVNVDMPFMNVIMKMEGAGFYIDQAAMNTLGKEFTAKKEAALERWYELSGGVNPNSTPQLTKYFYDERGFPVTRTTPSGKPSVDIMALKRLLPEDETGAIASLLEHRKYDKLIGTYITTFQDLLYNGRLYGSFNQTGTVTGRLSSSNPNLQNIPARGDEGGQVRALFAASPGKKIVVIDYSQIELRILAHYTKDPNLLKVFEEGLDPHQMTADLIGIDRKYAKSVNFGWAYGIGPRKLQDTIESATGHRPAESDTKAWLDGFGKAYPTATRWKWRVIEYARELGYVKTIAGRKRRLPEIKSDDKYIRGGAERQAVNSIIQGSTGDVMKYAMLEIDRIEDQYGAVLLGQVHDELIWECNEDTAEAFAEAASQIMIGAGDFFGLRVKLIAEPGIGNSWSEAK